MSEDIEEGLSPNFKLRQKSGTFRSKILNVPFGQTTSSNKEYDPVINCKCIYKWFNDDWGDYYNYISGVQSSRTFFHFAIYFTLVNGLGYNVQLLISLIDGNAPQYATIFASVLFLINTLSLILCWLLSIAVSTSEKIRSKYGGDVLKQIKCKAGVRHSSLGKQRAVEAAFSSVHLLCTRHKSALQQLFTLSATIFASLALVFQSFEERCHGNHSLLIAHFCRESDGMSLHLTIMTMILPPMLNFLLKDMDCSVTATTFIMAFAAIIFSAVTLQPSPSNIICLIIIYFSIVYFFTMESNRILLAMYRSNKRLQSLLLENERLARERQADDLHILITNVSHDLKTPLTTMLSAIEAVIASSSADLRRTLSLMQRINTCRGSSKVTAVAGASAGAVQTEEVATSGTDAIYEQVQNFLNNLSSSQVMVLECFQNLRNDNSLMVMTVNRCIDYSRAIRGLPIVPNVVSVFLADAIAEPLSVLNIPPSEMVQLNLPSSLLPRAQSAAPPAKAHVVCPYLFTDRQWLKENLICLLSNAIRHSATVADVELAVTLVRAESGSDGVVSLVPVTQDAATASKRAKIRKKMIVKRRTAGHGVPPSIGTPRNVWQKQVTTTVVSVGSESEDTEHVFIPHSATQSIDASETFRKRAEVSRISPPGTAVVSAEAGKRDGIVLSHGAGARANEDDSISLGLCLGLCSVEDSMSRPESGRSKSSTFSKIIPASLMEKIVPPKVHTMPETKQSRPGSQTASGTPTSLTWSKKPNPASSPQFCEYVSMDDAGSNAQEHADGEARTRPSRVYQLGSDGVGGGDIEMGSVTRTIMRAQNTLMLKFSVSDSGRRLTEEEKHNLFEPVQQRQRLTGGAGLGLYSLAKRVEALGGKYGIDVRDVADVKVGSSSSSVNSGVMRLPNTGNTFWFAIPYEADFATELGQELSISPRSQHDSAQAYESGIGRSEDGFVPLLTYDLTRKSGNKNAIGASLNGHVSSEGRRHSSHGQHQHQCPRSDSRGADSDSSSSSYNTAGVRFFAGQENSGDTCGSTPGEEDGESHSFPTVADAQRGLIQLSTVLESRSQDTCSMEEALGSPCVEGHAFPSISLKNGSFNAAAMIMHSRSNEEVCRLPSLQEDDGLNSAMSLSPANTSSRNKLSILLVDDSATILKMTGMMLKRSGHQVVTAENGQVAVDTLKKGYDECKKGTSPFDVVLMDLQMPVMDGVSAIRKLRGIEEELNALYASEASQPTAASHATGEQKSNESNQPTGGKFVFDDPKYGDDNVQDVNRIVSKVRQLVIACSANSNADSIKSAFDAGADEFIPKPFTIDVLESCVARCRQKELGDDFEELAECYDVVDIDDD